MTITDDIEKIDASPAGLIKRVHPPGLRHTRADGLLTLATSTPHASVKVPT